jgi:2'-5' RNA ligase
MIVDLALLVGYEVQNLIRKLTLQMHLEYGLDLVATLLPQHVSVKSSFQVDSMGDLENYFDGLAKRLSPFVFELQNIELVNFEKDGVMNEVIWINVRPNETLKKIHHQINQELLEYLVIPLSVIDGEAFNFHSTLFYRSNNKTPLELYEKAFQEIKDKKLDLTCVAREIALFCSPTKRENLFLSSFIYKLLPLGVTE